MKIGVPKEIKNNENRVGMTPAGVFELINSGHIVYVQENAGFGSGFTDADYKDVGAEILSTIEVNSQMDQGAIDIYLTQAFGLIRTALDGNKVEHLPSHSAHFLHKLRLISLFLPWILLWNAVKMLFLSWVGISEINASQWSGYISWAPFW